MFLFNGDKVNCCKILVGRKKTRFLQFQGASSVPGKNFHLRFPGSIATCNFNNDGCFKAQNGYFCFRNTYLVNLRLINLNSKDTLVIFEFMDGQKILLAFENEKRLGKLLIFLKNYDKRIFNNLRSDGIFHSSNLFTDQEELGFIFSSSPRQKPQIMNIPKASFGTVFENICALNSLFSKSTKAKFSCPQFPRILTVDSALNKWAFDSPSHDIVKSECSMFFQRLLSSKVNPEKMIFLKNIQFYNQLASQDESFDSPMIIQDFYDNPSFISSFLETEDDQGLTQRTYLSENHAQTRRLDNFKEKNEIITKAQNVGALTSTNKVSKHGNYFTAINEPKSKSRNKELANKQKSSKSPLQAIVKAELISIFDSESHKSTIKSFKCVYVIRKLIEKKDFVELIVQWFRLFFQIQGKNTLLLRGLQVKGPNCEFFVYNRANSSCLKEIICNLNNKAFRVENSDKPLVLSFEFPEALQPKKVLLASGELVHVLCNDQSISSLLLNRDQEYISNFKIIKLSKCDLAPFKVLKSKVL